MTDCLFNKKSGTSLLWNAEQKIIKKTLPRVPKFLNGHNLTLFSIPWILGVLVCDYLAQQNINWLWGISIILILHWLSDSFDGAISRYRKSGLVHWGFYMDHLLDFVFMTSILIGYGFIMNNNSIFWLYATTVAVAIIMMNSILTITTLAEFRINNLKIGPTEGRILLVVFNTITIFRGVIFIEKVLPYTFGALILYLIVVIFNTQRKIKKIDFDIKQQAKTP